MGAGTRPGGRPRWSSTGTRLCRSRSSTCSSPCFQTLAPLQGPGPWSRTASTPLNGRRSSVPVWADGRFMAQSESEFAFRKYTRLYIQRHIALPVPPPLVQLLLLIFRCVHGLGIGDARRSGKEQSDMSSSTRSHRSSCPTLSNIKTSAPDLAETGGRKRK